MTSHLLRVVENTSVELGALIQTEYLHRTLSCPEWTQFSWHYQGASEILYSEPFQKLMLPMRLAMASILDAVLFWFMQQPLFFSELKSAWYKIVQSNVPDIAEYRRLHRKANLYYNSPLPNETTLNQLFEEMGPKEEARKSVGTQIEDISGDRGWVNDQQHNLLTVCRERRGSL
ncbi:hypothetical protein NW762_000804 [Fusarium torreyae]|uniref:Uncharacterized protein n=1 Tax=Fusarium torreyae TaxID=1237075 RepID=A0A9W8SHU2_9HYPO|nr:hypothetical protein NW762_000804 [Fusarium torreyae]